MDRLAQVVYVGVTPLLLFRDPTPRPGGNGCAPKKGTQIAFSLIQLVLSVDVTFSLSSSMTATPFYPASDHVLIDYSSRLEWSCHLF